MTFVSFITPSIGRLELDSLTIPSIQAQTDDDWKGVIVCDGWERTYEGPNPDDRRFAWIGSDYESAGYSRNAGVAYAKQHQDPEWIAFVDDDDAVHPDYVKRLRAYEDSNDDWDCIIFKMQYPNGTILPDNHAPTISWGNVGISFAVRASWFPKVVFTTEDLSNPGPDGNEDVNLLLQLSGHHAKIALHSRFENEPSYYIRHNPHQ